MMKLWLALGFAAITALLVIIAGLFAEARATVVLFRAAVAFVVAASISYGMELLLTVYGIPRLVQREQDEPAQEASEADPVVEARENTETEDVISETEENEGSEGEKDFSPLSPDGLRHVSSPQD